MFVPFVTMYIHASAGEGDGLVLGDGVGATEGGTDGGTLGLPPQLEEKIWKEPQRLRLLLPPTQTSSTCPQPPAYAAAAA